MLQRLAAEGLFSTGAAECWKLNCDLLPGSDDEVQHISLTSCTDFVFSFVIISLISHHLLVFWLCCVLFLVKMCVVFVSSFCLPSMSYIVTIVLI